MENPEVPLEQVQEHIHHHAQHGSEGRSTTWIALSTAIIAALAALASMLAGHTETEAMHAKMDANDTWSWYQADSIKQHEMDGTAVVLRALGHEPDAKNAAKSEEYAIEKKRLKATAEAFDHESLSFLAAHTHYGYGVTMFQIAIALGAISVLTKRRRYWLMSLGLGVVGVVFGASGVVTQASIHAPIESSESGEAPHAAAAEPAQPAH